MALSIQTIGMALFMTLILVGLALAVLIDPYIRREHRRTMLIIAALCLTLIAQNYWDYALTVGTPRQMLRTMGSIYGYAVRPVILILFMYIVQPTGKRWYWWTLAAANAALYMTALFSPASFWIDGSNYFHAGPLACSCLVASMILLVSLFLQTYRSRRTGNRDVWIPIFVIVMIVASICLDYRIKEGQQPISFLTIAIIVGSVFYYLWLHLQFVREHERDLMAAQRIQIMMTQIQPHFLYNTLSTIQALCRTDPETAFAVTEKFGAYLRQNLDSLNQTDLIPIQKELEHARVYAEIETVRFPYIRIEYKIEDTDFSVPALTVQPLVENAIRHGVRGLKNGLVTVTTRAEDLWHEILISDNGKGFDPVATEQTGQGHIGIRNVRERVESMCGGSLAVDSRIGEGATVTIRIPVKGGAAAEKGE